jgi:hypothetical protein
MNVLVAVLHWHDREALSKVPYVAELGTPDALSRGNDKEALFGKDGPLIWWDGGGAVWFSSAGDWYAATVCDAFLNTEVGRWSRRCYTDGDLLIFYLVINTMRTPCEKRDNFAVMLEHTTNWDQTATQSWH